MCFALAWVLFAGGLEGFQALSNPRPTDDMFYIDAAWNLQNGTYAPPSAAAPYHHYLRWPVVLPLSFAMSIFGASEALLRLFPLAYPLLASAALAITARRFSREPAVWIAAAASPLLIPTEVMAHRVLSESASVAWFVVAIATLATIGRSKPRRALFVAGVCVAIATNAAQVALFSAPALPLFALLIQDRRAWTAQGAVEAVFWSALGFLVMYAAIASAEWLAFGDPLIQFRSVMMWHAKSLDQGTSLIERLLHPESPSFIAGFSLGFLKKHTLLVAILSGLAAIGYKWGGGLAGSPAQPCVAALLGSALRRSDH